LASVQFTCVVAHDAQLIGIVEVLHFDRVVERLGEALEIVREVGRARGEISAEGEAVLARIERILGLEPKAVAEPAPPAKKRSPTAAGA
jgi:hypothetical protein